MLTQRPRGSAAPAHETRPPDPGPSHPIAGGEMGDEDGRVTLAAVNTLRRIEAWAVYVEQDDSDAWLQGYEEAHRELQAYLTALGVPGLIVRLTGNQPTVPGAKT